MPTIDYVETLSEKIEDVMRNDLVAYEASYGIDVNFKKFALVLTNDDGQTVGVLNAYTAFAEIYIDDMWVHTSHRGKGYGRMLVEELEHRFKGKGFNNINLVTSAFQAPEFYKKCGFKVEFMRENVKNPKLTKTFFVKFLDDEVQNQGLIHYRE